MNQNCFLKPRIKTSFDFIIRSFSVRFNVRPKKKKWLFCPLRPTVKCEKTGSGFFFFLCQIWAKNLLKFEFNGLKKHLYMRFNCIPPEFSPFRNFKKNIGKLNSLTVRKKKKSKKKKIDRPTQFSDFGRWGQHNNCFFGLMNTALIAIKKFCFISWPSWIVLLLIKTVWCTVEACCNEDLGSEMPTFKNQKQYSERETNSILTPKKVFCKK